MLSSTRAILWAQWRTLFNYYPRHQGSLVFLVLMSAVWYGAWALGAAAVSILLANPERVPLFPRLLPAGLFLAFLYWQLVPLVLVSSGASMDLKRLLVYPIPPARLFDLEVLLRLSTGLEVLVVLAGATVGLLRNPLIPAWAPLAFVPFIVLNLFLAAGLRNLLARMLARKRVRELVVLLLVLAAAAPQLLVLSGATGRLRGMLDAIPFDGSLFQLLPWTAAARLAQGHGSAGAWLVLLGWTAVAWRFGRWQFFRGLRFDAEAARSTAGRPAPASGWRERLYRAPSVLLPDPLGAIVEKEIRFLSRAPRFRLVFLMGFTFGLVIWLPLALQERGSGSALSTNYLTFVSVYALLLLGEVTFWNSLGFDRSAAQFWYLAPVKFSTILVGKNIAAALVVFVEITAVALVCSLLGMPVSSAKLAEAYSVTLTLTVYLLAVGNLGSTHYPRPVNPVQSWRSASAGRFQALLLLLYPVVAVPVALAYGARYAFESETAFYLVMAFALALGAVVYRIAIESAVSTAEARKEKLLEALARGDGPVSA